MNVMKIGILLDNPAVTYLKENAGKSGGEARGQFQNVRNWKEAVAWYVNEASIIYENQMNVELATEWVIHYDGQDSSAPRLFQSRCNFGVDDLGGKLDELGNYFRGSPSQALNT